jgi:hypothetical protein
MAKLYSGNSSKKVNYLKPKKETVQFLLNYSKALKISNYKKLQFETFLN